MRRPQYERSTQPFSGLHLNKITGVPSKRYHPVRAARTGIPVLGWNLPTLSLFRLSQNKYQLSSEVYWTHWLRTAPIAVLPLNHFRQTTARFRTNNTSSPASSPRKEYFQHRYERWAQCLPWGSVALAEYLIPRASVHEDKPIA